MDKEKQAYNGDNIYAPSSNAVSNQQESTSIPEHGKLKRQLKNRHVAMISIGGVIGTRLFLGTATSLRSGGPIALLLGYIIIGSMCYSVMVSLGEMIAYLPIPGGQIKLAERFVDPALSFAMASSDLYISSRVIYGLTAAGNAPKVFMKTNKSGLLYVVVIFSSLFSLLAYMGIKSGSGRVFVWLSTMTAVGGLMSWIIICIIYLRFYAGLKSQGIDRKELLFASRLQPYAAWYPLALSFFISLFSGWLVFLKGYWSIDFFVTKYIALVLYPIIYIGAQIYHKNLWSSRRIWPSSQILMKSMLKRSMMSPHRKTKWRHSGLG